MEPKFSTSFIPKQTLAENTTYKQAPRRRAPQGALSLLFIITLIICMGSGVLAAFVFFNVQVLENSLTSKREQLAKAKEAFQPELIREMSNLDQRLQLAKQLLDSHIAPSEIFGVLQEFTLTTIQFTSFNYKMEGGQVSISMNGKARSFSSIALQTDEFVKSRIVVNPVFSNFVVGEKGDVSFNFAATIPKNVIEYEKVLSERQSDGVDSVNTQTQ